MISANMGGNLDILQSALTANRLRYQMVAENLSNVDTPGYKRKDVQFETYLQQALSAHHPKGISQEMIQPKVYTDNVNLQYRLDGNNVSVESETAYQAKTQMKYENLANLTSSNFSRMRLAIRNR